MFSEEYDEVKAMLDFDDESSNLTLLSSNSIYYISQNMLADNTSNPEKVGKGVINRVNKLCGNQLRGSELITCYYDSIGKLDKCFAEYFFMQSSINFM